MSDLAPELRERLAQEHPDLSEVALVFLVEPQHTELLEREKFLELAVRATVRN